MLEKNKYLKNNIIDFDENYILIFLEDNTIKFKSPVSNYLLNGDDMSINLFINLKWIKWGFHFFNNISITLNNSDIDINQLIHNNLNGKITFPNKLNHILLLDNQNIKNEEDLNNLIYNFYSLEYFNENTKIHFKLKLNFDEYYLISNFLFPALAKPN